MNAMHESIEKSCAHCRYFQAVDALNGTCHRFPPVFAGDSSPREMHRWRFPAVNMHAWCGEFLPLRVDQASLIGATI